MGVHGGAARGGCMAASIAPGIGAHQGFRHVMGPPAPEDRFAGAWAEAFGSAAWMARVQRLMGGLARLMHVPEAGAADAPRFNEAIPAGYTYLLQFMAHDMVATATPAWALGAAATELRNMRPARLRLDVLYGGGPETCPFAYAPESAAEPATRLRLRLGRAGTAARPGTSAPPVAGAFRDVPRIPAPDAGGGRPAGLPDTLLADARNDDNTNIAQMAVLFSALHNAILDRLPAPADAEAARRLSPQARFACAREAAALIFRAVIRRDLLPRLLHPGVLAAYAAFGAGDFLDAGDAAEAGLALEFSHGAFRFGHAMVRESYAMNEASTQDLAGVLMRTSLGMPHAMPPGRDWMIRWGHFFPMDPGAPVANPSRRIRPTLSGDLQLAARFPAIDATGAIGLGYRDLMSAALSGLWSVPALMARIAAQLPDLVRGHALADAATREARLAAWLGRAPMASGFGAPEVALLAADPPLPFYVLFEASAEEFVPGPEGDAARRAAGGEAADGRRLGLLGSVLVAEAVMGSMLRDPLPAEEGRPDLAAQLGWLTGTLLGAPCPAGLADCDTMPKLVRLAATAPGLGTTDPDFI